MATVLLPFNSARITSDESSFLERRTEIRIHLHQRASDSMTNGTRLTRISTPDNVDVNVEASSRLGKVKWLKDDHPSGFTAEVFLQRPVIDNDLSLPRS